MNAATKFDLITETSAQAIASKVNDLKKHWITRDAYALYTLGAASYLDVAPEKSELETNTISAKQDANEKYTTLAAAQNTILESEFAELYATLTDGLQTILDANVEYASNKALPGFHIFNHHDIYTTGTNHVTHFDRQYESLDWGTSIQKNGVADTVSFTLPLKLPASGSGLTLWDVNFNDIIRMEKSQAKESIKQARKWKENYQPGQLVCHPGHTLHRIAPWHSTEQDQRITLQGHGIKLNGSWKLYW